MLPGARVGLFRAGILACMWLLCGRWTAHAADARVAGATNGAGAELAPLTAPGVQEQQDALRQAIEDARREADSAARRNVETVIQRLELFQQSLEAQHRRELEAVRNSNGTTLMVAGVLAGAGFLGLFSLAFFLMRVTSRLTDVAVSVPLGHALGQGHGHAALVAGESHLPAGNPTELIGSRFFEAIEQLEKRLHELEHATEAAPVAQTSHRANGQPKSEAAVSAAKPEGEVIAGVAQHPRAREAAVSGPVMGYLPASRVALLLAKGQTLLSLEKAAEGLACVEEVIALDPSNAEALVKKGTALERLGRPEEALECYDRAIAVDGSLTAAYLHKGGVFNRLERYGEALKCYEQALHTEQKTLEPKTEE